MTYKDLFRLFFGAVLVTAALCAQSRPTEESWRRVLRMTDTEQAAYMKTYLDSGMAAGEGDGLNMLVLNRSSLVLPIIEKKIEEVLRSQNPAECFTTKGVDRARFIDGAAVMIGWADDEHALKEVAKLIVIDEKRFDRLVTSVLAGALSHQKRFRVSLQRP